MKSIVLYSTRTGNTKMVAEAIASALPAGTPCVDIKNLPEDVAAYDLAFMGFWVDKGTADDGSKAVLAKLTNPHVAVFGTLGANPQGEHAQKSMDNAVAFLPAGKKPVATFICQGKVDPKLIEAMYKRFPPESLHGKNAASEARHKAASTHPDAQDLANAKAFAQKVLAAVGA